MKKVLSLVLVLAMVLGSFSFVSAAEFTDVTGTEFVTAVERLDLLGILEGYPDGTFKPAGEITRAEFAAVAIRSKGLKEVALAAQGLTTGFTDVPATHWASGYVGTAGRLGIVNGIGWGEFAPASPVKYEEAVTMVVRALGYEAAAQAKGGYPYGYLIVASENGLLDDVKGVQGTNATRGLVARLVDNALEIPMMIQVGFGTDAKWVISGSREHGDNAVETYLLDELGFDSVEGRVVSVNTKTDKITVDPTDEDLKTVTLEVAEGFDFYAVEGLETKFWYKDDMVEVYVVNEDAKFDAVEVDDDELTLVVEDENYEVARNAILTIDGEEVDQDEFDADYAKVVLNDDDEIIWAQGYNLDGFVLVEEVKDEVAYSYDDYDEVDLEDFTVIKEGKTIAIAAIEAQDVLFFNAEEEFAIVYNKGTEGELDRVYADATFRFEGSAYAKSALATPIYFDEAKVGELDATILDDFLDEEATITVFVDFAGDVVVVSGEVNSVGNSAYAVVTANVVEYSGRKGSMVAIDVRNGANEKVSYDILVADLDDDVKLTNISVAEIKGIMKADNVVLEISVDKDGDVTAIELPESVELKEAFDIDDANAKGTDNFSYKLQSGTIVFYDSNKEAITLGNAKDEFSEVKAGATIYTEKGRVVAVVGETDTDADTKDVAGLVTGVKDLTNGQLQFTVKVFGTSQRLVTEDKDLKLSDFANYKDTIRTFEVGETSGEIKGFKDILFRTLTINSISGRVITPNPTTNKAVELNSNAVIYDNEFETMNLRELKKDDVVTVYFQGSSNRFVDYVTVGGAAILPPVVTTGVVTYINGTGSAYSVDGVIYTTDAKTVVKNAAGSVIGLGDALALTVGDQIKTEANVITIVKTLEEFQAADLLAAQTAVTALETAAAKDLTVAANLTAAEAALEAAQTAVDKLPADVAPATTKTALQGRINTEEATVTAARTAFNSANAVSEVIAKIDAIPATVTLAAKATVEAARTAYNNLLPSQTGSVTNYTDLTDAEAIIVGLEADAANLVLAKDEVAVAKTALTALAVTKVDDTNSTIAKPADHTNGSIYTLALGTLPTFTTGSVSGLDPVAIEKDAAAFTFEITVTISSTVSGQTATDTVVFTVTVPNTVAPITVAK